MLGPSVLSAYILNLISVFTINKTGNVIIKLFSYISLGLYLLSGYTSSKFLIESKLT